ncbi:MAG: TIGR03936 family radical SAM-associated protein [Anaerovoracaceae bacterium]
MSRYVLKFHKTGYVKYTSHLDLLRIFKRSFKKTGIALRYSQGFNPHPKMGFAQPLSLGYSSLCELIEFETVADHEPSEILKKMQEALPEGLEPVSCQRFDQNIKSLAGEADSAVYVVWVPIPLQASNQWSREKVEAIAESYLKQNEITAMKRQKKTKKLAPVDIRKQIRSLQADVTASPEGEMTLELTMLLDCGSTSNLSPELVLTTFCQFADLPVERYQVEVERKSLNFVNNLQF